MISLAATCTISLLIQTGKNDDLWVRSVNNMLNVYICMLNTPFISSYIFISINSKIRARVPVQGSLFKSIRHILKLHHLQYDFFEPNYIGVRIKLPQSLYFTQFIYLIDTANNITAQNSAIYQNAHLSYLCFIFLQA